MAKNGRWCCKHMFAHCYPVAIYAVTAKSWRDPSTASHDRDSYDSANDTTLTIPGPHHQSGAAVSAVTCISVQSRTPHSATSHCSATADQQYRQQALSPRQPPMSRLHHPLGTDVCHSYMCIHNIVIGCQTASPDVTVLCFKVQLNTKQFWRGCLLLSVPWHWCFGLWRASGLYTTE